MSVSTFLFSSDLSDDMISLNFLPFFLFSCVFIKKLTKQLLKQFIFWILNYHIIIFDTDIIFKLMTEQAGITVDNNVILLYNTI